MFQTVAVSNVVCAIICAKWALDLGFSQFSQILHGIGGLLFGPFVLLILYTRLIYQARARQESGGRVL
jgi:hypothetical protein